MFTLNCIDSSIHIYKHVTSMCHLFQQRRFVSQPPFVFSNAFETGPASERTMAAVEVPELTEKMKELSTEVTSGGSLSCTG